MVLQRYGECGSNVDAARLMWNASRSNVEPSALMWRPSVSNVVLRSLRIAWNGGIENGIMTQ